MKNNIKLKHKLTLLFLAMFAIKYSYSSIKSDRADLGNLTASIFILKKIAPPSTAPIITLPVSTATISSDSINITKQLLDDFKHYITNNIDWHSGDLYQHSIWVSNVVAKWWKDNRHWVKDIDPKDKNLSILAGLIHDIGKGGTLAPGANAFGYPPLTTISDGSTKYYPYYDIRLHPKTGFDYLTKKSYKLAPDGTKLFDYDSFFDKFNISDEDRKLLAIIVGIHWDFGGIVFKKKDTIPNDEDRYKIYLNNLRCLAINANYNNGNIDERLIRIALLVSAADVLGTFPFDPKEGLDVYVTKPNPTKNIFDIATPDVPDWNPAFIPKHDFAHHKIKDLILKYGSLDAVKPKKIAYYKYGYADDNLGKKYKNGIINYFKSPAYQATLSTKMDKKSCMNKFVADLTH